MAELTTFIILYISKHCLRVLNIYYLGLSLQMGPVIMVILPSIGSNSYYKHWEERDFDSNLIYCRSGLLQRGLMN